MSGLTPRRTLEKITIGSVLEPGPATKLVMTRSSSDSVNASSQPESSAGKMIGSVMRKKTLCGRAPRSIAASSSESSICDRRDCTTIVTKAIVKVMCEITIVVMPRPAGQPISCSSVTNSSSSESPVMTSGMTSGAVARPDSSVRPLNGPKRASAMPASVPSTTASVAESTAILMLSQAAPRICSLRNSAPYHLVENPPQTVTSLDSLNEYTISDTIGVYRNAKPSVSTIARNRLTPGFTGAPRRRPRHPGHADRASSGSRGTAATRWPPRWPRASPGC